MQEGYISPGLYSDSEVSGSGSEEVSDEEGSYEDDDEEEDHSGSNVSDVTGDEDDDIEHLSEASCSGSESCHHRGDKVCICSPS